MTVLMRCTPFAIALAFWCAMASAPALAECPNVDKELGIAQIELRNAEPARDRTRVDFERRIALVSDAYDHTAMAETIRTTTPGGCGNIQQVYVGMLTLAWADIMLSYLKPSFEYYVSDPTCVAESHVQTQAVLLEAYEALNHSLIAWNPFDPGVIAAREHVTKLVGEAAGYLKIGMPSDERADDFARAYRYQLEKLKSKSTVDCTNTVTDPTIPKAIVTKIFG